jgi:hypothetical protein
MSESNVTPAKNNEAKNQQEDFGSRAEQIIRPLLEKQRAQGIRIGMLSCSKIVMDKLNDKSKSLMDRITDVKRFCNVAIKNEKFLEEVTTVEPEEIAEQTEDDVNE